MEIKELEQEEILKFYRGVYAMHIRSVVELSQLSVDNLTLSDPKDIKELQDRRSKAKIVKETTADTMKTIREELL